MEVFRINLFSRQFHQTSYVQYYWLTQTLHQTSQTLPDLYNMQGIKHKQQETILLGKFVHNWYHICFNTYKE